MKELKIWKVALLRISPFKQSQIGETLKRELKKVHYKILFFIDPPTIVIGFFLPYHHN